MRPAASSWCMACDAATIAEQRCYSRTVGLLDAHVAVAVACVLSIP